jgi:predicted metal-dependent RNase
LEELLAWMQPLAGGLKKVFLVHGEPEQQAALITAIRGRYGLEAVAPNGDRVLICNPTTSSKVLF